MQLQRMGRFVPSFQRSPSLSSYQHWYQVVDLLVFLQKLQYPHHSAGCYVHQNHHLGVTVKHPVCTHDTSKTVTSCHWYIEYSTSLCIHIVKCKTGQHLSVCDSYVRVHMCFASVCVCASTILFNKATPETPINASRLTLHCLVQLYQSQEIQRTAPMWKHNFYLVMEVPDHVYALG